jgi:hypothetical protein
MDVIGGQERSVPHLLPDLMNRREYRSPACPSAPASGSLTSIYHCGGGSASATSVLRRTGHRRVSGLLPVHERKSTAPERRLAGVDAQRGRRWIRLGQRVEFPFPTLLGIRDFRPLRFPTQLAHTGYVGSARYRGGFHSAGPAGGQGKRKSPGPSKRRESMRGFSGWRAGEGRTPARRASKQRGTRQTPGRNRGPNRY